MLQITPRKSDNMKKEYSPLHIAIPPISADIPHCAFQDTENLEWVSIPESVRNIGDWAFCGCGNLKKVLLKPGLESIGESAFSQTCIREIFLPDTLHYLGESAFDDTMLETITIPGGIRNLYADTFRGNLYLHTVCLKEGIQRIANGAFAWCRHLQEIYIPDSLEIIEPYAFEDSTPIASIHASPRWRWEHPEYMQLLSAREF